MKYTLYGTNSGVDAEIFEHMLKDRKIPYQISVDKSRSDLIYHSPEVLKIMQLSLEKNAEENVGVFFPELKIEKKQTFRYLFCVRKKDEEDDLNKKYSEKCSIEIDFDRKTNSFSFTCGGTFYRYTPNFSIVIEEHIKKLTIQKRSYYLSNGKVEIFNDENDDNEAIFLVMDRKENISYTHKMLDRYMIIHISPNNKFIFCEFLDPERNIFFTDSDHDKAEILKLIPNFLLDYHEIRGMLIEITRMVEFYAK